MKTMKILVFLIGISLILSGCSSPSTGSEDKIVSPENQLLPIEGTWEVSDVLVTGATNEYDDEYEWIGKEIQFANSHMSVDEVILENPQYQMKRVNREQYLLFNSKSLPENFTFSNKEIEVVTVIDVDKFFCEVLIINKNELILIIEGNTLHLNKVSNEVDEYIISEVEIEDNQGISIEKDESEMVQTGVLIGLRSEDTSNGSDDKYSYRTLWISSTNDEINPILEMENIFFPRRSGFWKLAVKETNEDNKTEEYISSNNVSMEDTKEEMQLRNRTMALEGLAELKKSESHGIDFSRWPENTTGKITRKINYVGNDYISVETVGKGMDTITNADWQTSKLELLAIDSLPNGSGVKISDISGENGTRAIKSAWERTIANLEIDSPDILYREELLENFGMERKLGNWLFKGRINYIKNNEFNVADYSINLIPPSEVVFYDTLFVPWTNIKDRVPSALDVYTSPNKDVAIVITNEELLIYDINGNDLDRYPRIRLDLKEGETVIMAEWATGKYVENWEKTFQRSGGQVVQ